MIEFVLIGLLGFMPLIIIHWADRRPRFRVPRFRSNFRQDVLRLAATAKTLVLVWVSGWSSGHHM